ncbi:MAG TPA: hypothetical protein VH083_22120 [Myxococcales bacterium]|jgi:hypothetical protein|nr:hypothetical protein [Myxococcales bacterium]
MIAALLAILLAAELQGDAGTVVVPISAPAAKAANADAGVAPALPEASPLGLELKVEPEEITLGQHIIVKLSVEHDARDVYALPGFDPAPLAVPQGAPAPTTSREELPGKARTTFGLTLVDLGSLEPRIPDLVLHVTGPDGERSLTVRGRPIKFKSLVKHENQGADDAAHHGPKPPVQVMIRSFLWVAVLAGLLLLAAAIVGIYFWRKRAKIVPAKVVPEVPYDDRALEELRRLRVEKPWARGAGRAAIFQLSEIVRGYLGTRLAFNALDLTSEELVEELKQRRLMGLDLPALAEEVQWEDLVKFAKLEPTTEECLRGVERAESIIHHTRPLRTTPTTGAAAMVAKGAAT